MSALRSILQQPLVHFLLLGGLIFGAFSFLEGEEGAAQDDIIVVELEAVRQLSAGYEKTWRRKPDGSELASLIDDHIREEVLVREAQSFALDENDVVIRRRLRQKMEFLVESAVAALQPSDEELKVFFQANVEDYTMAGRIALEQVFIGTEANGAAIDTVKAALEGGADPMAVGQRSLLPPTTPLATETAIDGTFGTGFYGTLAELPEGAWVGPVRSGYGLHVVRVVKREEARIPEFEQVKEHLEHDWRKRKTSELSNKEYRRMLSRYSVTQPDPAETVDLVR